MRRKRKPDPEIGSTFGLWTVVSSTWMVGKKPSRKRIVVCECFCGKRKVVHLEHLQSKRSTKCTNCSHKILTQHRTQHGESNSRLYRVWKDMKHRCESHRNKYYHVYGGRGITVCSEWAGSYEEFRDWAHSNGYAEHLTLDRIDNDGDYEPSNCRWTTNKEQQRNKQCNRILTHQGQSMTMVEWAEELGIKYVTLKTRLNKLGWPVERALTAHLR